MSPRPAPILAMVLSLMAAIAVTGCGKYGEPMRAGEAQRKALEARKPGAPTSSVGAKTEQAEACPPDANAPQPSKSK